MLCRKYFFWILPTPIPPDKLHLKKMYPSEKFTFIKSTRKNRSIIETDVKNTILFAENYVI